MSDPDCRTCGACCAVNFIVVVEEDERLRVSRALLPIVGFGTGIEPYGADQTKLPHDDGSCPALAGKVGEDVSCSVYDDRPRVCAEFTPGSPMCIDTRAVWFGDDDQLDELTERFLDNALVAIERRDPERAKVVAAALERARERDAYLKRLEPCDSERDTRSA